MNCPWIQSDLRWWTKFSPVDCVRSYKFPWMSMAHDVLESLELGTLGHTSTFVWRVFWSCRVGPHIYILVTKDPNSESMVIFSVVWTQYGTKYLVQVIRYSPPTCMERIKELVLSIAHPFRASAHNSTKFLIGNLEHEESPSTTTLTLLSSKTG